jgi:serine/threonine protein kinase
VELPAPFGKYHLLERLAVGGMAEIYLAKAFGAAGFERLLVIKKILPHMAEDDEFITMFIDEARIASTLNHSNVAQINELGKEGGAYFIAMEFVHGKDLSRIYERSVQVKRNIPIPLAVLIASRICEGLDYAHRRTDSTGNNLQIIHRDVSPGNVLVSYDGDVKLIDFGIAKATNRMGRTTAGTLKGKFGYMSPEQVRGLPLDHRSDVFTVGILLYEMLTGERLFGGESDFGTLEKVRNAIVTPPTTYNRKIPKELENTVLRALAKDPEERHEWASDLQEDLVRFLMHDGSLITGKSLASFVRDLFSKDIARENERLAVYRRRGYPWVDEALSKKGQDEAVKAPEDQGYPEDETVEHVSAQPTVILSDDGITHLPGEGGLPSLADQGDLAGQATMILPDAIEEEPTPAPAIKKQPERRPARQPMRKRSGTDVRRRGSSGTEQVRGRAPLRGKRPDEAARKKRLAGTVAAFCLGLFVAVVAAFFLFTPSNQSPEQEEETASRVEMTPIRPPEEPAAPPESPAPESPLPAAREPEKVEPEKSLPPAEAEVAKEAPEPEKKPPSKVAAAIPAEKKPDPKPVERVFPAPKPPPEPAPKAPSKRKRKKNPKVASHEPKESPSILVKSTPPGAEILLNGKKIGKTPTTVGGLNPKKNYFMVLKKDGYKPFFHGVKFKGEKRVVIDATLEPGKFAAKESTAPGKPGGKGFLIANTKPWARVIIDGKDTGQWTPIVGKRKLAVPAGGHEITFQTKEGKTLTVKVTIQAGQITKVIKQIP